MDMHTAIPNPLAIIIGIPIILTNSQASEKGLEKISMIIICNTSAMIPAIKAKVNLLSDLSIFSLKNRT